MIANGNLVKLKPGVRLVGVGESTQARLRAGPVLIQTNSAGIRVLYFGNEYMEVGVQMVERNFEVVL